MNTQLSLYQPLALFVPNSAGDSATLLNLTLQAVSQTFPFMSHLVEVVGQARLKTVRIEQMEKSHEGMVSAAALKVLFDRFGSDKSSNRNYHLLYGEILKNPADVSSVLEFGLGTNNPNIASNMGSDGVSGASVRAFREHLPNAMIFGADVDTDTLFQEERIKTFYVDQTDLKTFEALGQNLPEAFDLIIDDGLHAPNANLAVLAFGLTRLKRQGWLVIEDIAERAIPLWEVVAALLPSTFSCWLVRADGGLLFAVRKDGNAD
jgi:hypothetical protein